MQVSGNLGLTPPAIAGLPVSPKANPKATPKDAGQAFESMFASILLKQMRQSMTPGQGLFGHDPSDVMGGLFDHFMGQHIAQRNGLGIAHMIQKSLEQRGDAK